MVKGLRLVAAKFTAFAAVSVLSFMLIYNTMQDNVDGNLIHYRATFRDVSGLRVDDSIRVAGVQVGKVTAIDLAGGSARVAFSLRDTQPLLESTRIIMRYQNLLGQRYLALVQGAERGARLQAGATIPLSRTDPGFDLTALLNGFRPLFDVLEPQEVNGLARTVVQVLQGEGGTVNQILAQTAQLTSFFADRDEILGEILANLTPVLRDVNGQGDEIGSTVHELKALMSGLAGQRETVGTSIEQISALVTQASDFLAEAKAPSIRLLKRLRDVAGMFVDNLAAVQAAIQGFPNMVAVMGRLTSYQNGVNVYVCKIRLKIAGAQADLPPTDGPYSKVCGG